MKKLVKFCFVLMIFSFNINVFATEDSSLEEETTPVVGTSSSDATLTDVSINNQKVVCSDYVCELIIKDNSVNTALITYKTNDEKATVSKEKIEGALKVGENLFDVTVTAEDGTEKKYTFKVTKEVLDTDSSLKKLVINGEEIKLKENTLKYQTTVSYATKKLEIEATPNSSKAVLVDSKTNKISYDFFDTEKEIRIKVQAEAGEMTTYVITVKKREEADATLKSLEISNLSIPFESGVFDYEATVLKSVNQLEIEAEPTDSEAKVTIDNPKTLEIGENTVKIEVDNDGNIKTYTIKVTKLEEEDKNLANLKSLKIDGYDLDFKEDKYEYNLKIGDVNFLVIEALPKISDAEVLITGNLDLVDGSIIKIKVNYDEETFNIYKINITKETTVKAENNTLKIVIIIVIVCIILAIIVLFIIQMKNKKNNKNNGKKEKSKIKLETKEKEKKEIHLNTPASSDSEEIVDII